MEKTLFQRIIDREIPATVEYEDNDFIAIRDIAPSASTHILIIPKKLIPSAHHIEASDAELVGRAYLVAQQLATKLGIAQSGYRVVTNVNADAGQTVFHLHFHLLGGEPLGRMNSRDASHSRSSSRSGMLRDAGLLVLASIGLAIGFNMMNPKGITWLKKEFEHVSADDSSLDKYLPQTGSSSEKWTNSEIEKQKTINGEIEKQRNRDSSSQMVKSSNDQVDPVVKSSDRQISKFAPEPGVVKEITKKQFEALMAAGPYYLIDARTPESYAKGHIKDAHNIYGAEAEANIPTILGSVPRDRVVLIYCDGGECELSHHVADVLKNFGYGPVFIFTGGWAEWTK